MAGHYNVGMNRADPSLHVKVRQRIERAMVVGVIRDIGIVQPNLGGPLLVPYAPSLRSTQNEVAAAIHRFGCEMPHFHDVEPFVAYACEFIRQNLQPVSVVPTWEEWIAQTPYSGARRRYFTKLRAEINTATRKTTSVQAFIKAEGYLEPKQPRAICSPSDESKVLLGPVCWAVDKSTFASVPYFVKGTDPRDWPSKLQELFQDGPVTCTDFSSFEAHHRGPMADIIKFWFRHMLRNVEGKRRHLRLIKAMIGERRSIKMPTTDVAVDERLMSGALWTSSSNGLLNLLIMSYLSLRATHRNVDGPALLQYLPEFRGLVEGDDGITSYVDIDSEDIKRLGLRLKMERHASFATAGFCSIYCDSASMDTVKDPLKTLRNFFVLPPQLQNAKRMKVLAMLRAKAMSMKYLAGNAPVVGPLADHVLELTRSVAIEPVTDYLSAWERELISRARQSKAWKQKAAVSESARLMVERVFKVSTLEQARIESGFQGHVMEIDLADYANRTDAYHSATFVQSLSTEPHVPQWSNILDELLQELPRGRRKCSAVDDLPEGGIEMEHDELPPSGERE